MLDIYALADDEATPEAPEEVRYLGSLTLEDFRALDAFLQRCAAEGIRLGYFEDGRMRSAQVRRMLALGREWLATNRLPATHGAYAPLLALLEKAANDNAGFIAFAD